MTAASRYSRRTLTASLVLVSLLCGFRDSAAQEDPNVALFNSRYHSGTQALAKQDYEEAIKYFQLAYAQKPEALLLYNIAQCHRKLRHNAEAITYYQSFLNNPDPVDEQLRAKATRYIAELRTPQAPPSPKVIYVENAREPRPGWRIGLGLGLLAASSLPLGFGGRALYLDGACSDTPTGMQTRCTNLVDTKGLGSGLVAAGVIVAIGGIGAPAIPARGQHVPRPATPADSVSPEPPRPTAQSLPLLPLFNRGTEPLAAVRE